MPNVFDNYIEHVFAQKQCVFRHICLIDGLKDLHCLTTTNWLDRRNNAVHALMEVCNLMLMRVRFRLWLLLHQVCGRVNHAVVNFSISCELSRILFDLTRFVDKDHFYESGNRASVEDCSILRYRKLTVLAHTIGLNLQVPTIFLRHHHTWLLSLLLLFHRAMLFQDTIIIYDLLLSL